MLRLLIGIVLGAVIVVFAIQNGETVTYFFLGWDLEASRAVIVIGVFVFGLVAGWLIAGMNRLGRRRR